VFTFGDARFHGSTGSMHLQKPIVGMARTRSGRGYWLVASDGGIFSFGDARFHGSTGAMHLARPIVGMARTASGNGYWLVASDGGIFSFGDAHFYGSGRGAGLTRPVVSMSVGPGGAGYYMVAADGRVLAFGSAVYMGSATGMLGGQLAAAIIAAPKVGGYWVASQWGVVGSANSRGMHADPRLPRSGEAAINNELVNRINTERVRRGLKPLAIDPLLSSYASSWAHHLALTNTWGHQDLSAILRNANGRLGEAGENLFAGAGPGATDAGTAHGALMVSDPHRENILVPEERLVGIGAVCVSGKLVVVEDFGTPSGIPLLPHPEPPLQPFAASDPGGARC
jgi:uncharacterized protein YkwD